MNDLKIYVGYDSREDVAYRVCKHSIESKNSNTDIIPIQQSDMRDKGLYWRGLDPMSSTEFTFTRFLVPALQDYKGWALFIDCDTLLLTDVAELFDLADEQYAVMVAKHEYWPSKLKKMDGKDQHLYPRKNWSSVMLINCGHEQNLALTKDLVSHPNTTGATLHRFSWLDDEVIGTLHHEWNWLINWYHEPMDGTPKLLHYTEGGPWLAEYFDSKYADVWKNEYKSMTGKTFAL